MKPFFIAKWITVIIAALNIVRAEPFDARKEIETTLSDYLTAMSARDVKGLQAVLDKRFVAVEAADENAKIHVVDTAKGAELLPPEGNDDWEKGRIKLSTIEVKISDTHPSVAMASFTLTLPLSDERVADLSTVLRQAPAEFDEARRKAVAKIISDRAIHNSMFAMLARQDGRWKIAAMSFPK